jgi:hypothetical protein
VFLQVLSLDRDKNPIKAQNKKYEYKNAFFLLDRMRDSADFGLFRLQKIKKRASL